ncbi:MAG: hypothetical protein Q8P26_04225 [Candidatus Levybacteria bacterium]|nr:hypothetical protein [Candidatus Levybacteria bacterium]MDZ4227977.1 hypothetical protein [Candidatus Levybacteria bacterium]
MKSKFKSSLLLGGIIFFFGFIGVFKNVLGVSWNCGIICLDLDFLLVMGSIWGMICSFIAHKKNRNPNSALFVGLFLGPLGILYYLIAKSGMNDKERELHDWEVDKKYQEMMKERSK